jgi:hypothetical protein
MVNRLDQPDELPLISGMLGVLRHQLAAEESHWSTSLMEHNTQASVGRVAFHDEVAIKVWELWNWCRGERML